jgi:hypothetical protein
VRRLIAAFQPRISFHERLAGSAETIYLASADKFITVERQVLV